MKNEKSLAIIDSTVLAEYILQRGGKMSHLKLQKLAFYIQALHLAYFDNPIIDDDFQAWLHGPVSRKLYDVVKEHSVLYNEVQYDPSDWYAREGYGTGDRCEVIIPKEHLRTYYKEKVYGNGQNS